MIFAWLLLKPILSLVEGIVGPILGIIAVLLIDHYFQLGLTNMVIEWFESYIQSQITGGIL